MEIQYKKEYSHALGKEMEWKRYGTQGCVCIYIPCQNGRFFDFENFGMLDVCREWIESGRLQVFSVDTVDEESFSAEWKAGWDRIGRQEQYYHYIAEELAGYIKWITGCESMMVMGFSMGAYHAANFYFRRPDLFSKGLCLSGLYSARDMMGDYMDALVYANSPIDSLRNMPWDHPYLSLYRKNRLIVCTGQGAWEDLMIPSTGELKRILEEKQIPAWVDFWGYDVCHDWCWWKVQVPYFLPKLLD